MVVIEPNVIPIPMALPNHPTAHLKCLGTPNPYLRYKLNEYEKR